MAKVRVSALAKELGLPPFLISTDPEGGYVKRVPEGVLKTPPNDAGILEGITRNCVIQLAEQAGIPIQQVTLQRHDIYTADECFLTGTAAEVIPVVSIDGRPIGTGVPGPMTQDLRKRFQKFTRDN